MPRDIQRTSTYAAAAFLFGWVCGSVFAKKAKKRVPKANQSDRSEVRQSLHIPYCTRKTRISIMTFNVWRPHPIDFWETANQAWGQERYDRRTAQQEFLKLYASKTDIFCLQEVTAQVMEMMINDTPLGQTFGHMFKEDTTSGAAVFWNRQTFRQIGGDACRVGKVHLAWARLQMIGDPDVEMPTIVACSIHLSFPGYDEEFKTGLSPRVTEMNVVLDFIESTAKPQDNEFVYLCGDLNDHFHPIWVAMKRRFRHCWSDLNMLAPCTFPTPGVHVVDDPDPQSSTTYDWIIGRKFSDDVPFDSECCAAQVVDYHYRGLYPSDHFPLFAVFQLKW